MREDGAVELECPSCGYNTLYRPDETEEGYAQCPNCDMPVKFFGWVRHLQKGHALLKKHAWQKPTSHPISGNFCIACGGMYRHIPDCELEQWLEEDL